jgi:hypothetical protein
VLLLLLLLLLQVNYNEFSRSDSGQVLDDLTGGRIPNVHAWRDQVGGHVSEDAASNRSECTHSLQAVSTRHKALARPLTCCYCCRCCRCCCCSQLGADFVALFQMLPDVCGIAWVGGGANFAFSTTNDGCWNGYTHAHEIGEGLLQSLHKACNICMSSTEAAFTSHTGHTLNTIHIHKTSGAS